MRLDLLEVHQVAHNSILEVVPVGRTQGLAVAVVVALVALVVGVQGTVVYPGTVPPDLVSRPV
jgi:hypothetical protein